MVLAQNAMNTTRSISDFSRLDAGSYAVIGDTSLSVKSDVVPGFSVILTDSSVLNLPAMKDMMEKLFSIGACEIVCLERILSTDTKTNIHILCRQISHLRFLIFSEETSWGARINTAIGECSTPYQFVFRGNMAFSPGSLDSESFREAMLCERICTVPAFRDEVGELLPTVFGPIITNRNRFETQPIHPGRGESCTLLPWDYTAVYKKDRHMALGGFDIKIREPWWQKLEYGLRAWLWGEEIKTQSSLVLKYIDQSTTEDYSPGTGYSRFFFKTLAIRYRKNQGRFPNSLMRTLSNMNSLSVGRRQIQELRLWFRQNRHRYTRDALSLARQWNWDEDGTGK